jgi:hypothetical protein
MPSERLRANAFRGVTPSAKRGDSSVNKGSIASWSVLASCVVLVEATNSHRFVDGLALQLRLVEDIRWPLQCSII